MRRLLVFVFLAVSLWSQDDRMMRPPGAEKERDPNEDKYIGNPLAVQAGKDLYAIACTGCHGPNGEGGRGPNLVVGLAGENQVRREVKEIFAAIKDGVAGSEMPPFPLPEDQLWKLTAFVRSLSAPAYEIEVPGQPEVGGTLFFGKLGCSNCHMIRGRGGFLGPDLSNAGLSNYMIQLREGLLDPNARITLGFDPVRVTTRSGKTIEGVAKSYTNYSIQVLDAKGSLHSLTGPELQNVIFLKKTWMPDDYAKRFTEDEIQNVLAFLSRQAARLPSSMEEKKETE